MQQAEQARVMAPETRRTMWAGITPNVRALGVVSLLTDASTEMIYPFLPMFLTPVEARASAYGVYHTAIGITALPASLLTGWLWQAFGTPAAFGTGALVAGAAAVLLWLLLRDQGMALTSDGGHG